MKKIIYITNLPAFYKINLFNGIAEKSNLKVIYTHRNSKDRNEDFYKGDSLFEYYFVDEYNLLKKLNFIRKIIKNENTNELIIGGWDQFLFFLLVYINQKKKNSVVVESSIYESVTIGFKGFLKKLFLKRVSKAYCSGNAQIDLVQKMGFDANIIKTKGVGVFNVIKQPIYVERNTVKNFLYVGRLSKEKNLSLLIEVFNNLSYLNLTIIGFGPQEMQLRTIAKSNITFAGAVDNNDLPIYYQQNEVFILPSISETWGLVVEEALNNGLPVIVSDRVGCKDEIVNEENGLIFQYNNPKDLEKAILKMTDETFYNRLRKSISNLDFDEIIKQQINVYLQ